MFSVQWEWQGTACAILAMYIHPLLVKQHSQWEEGQANCRWYLGRFNFTLASSNWLLIETCTICVHVRFLPSTTDCPWPWPRPPNLHPIIWRKDLHDQNVCMTNTLCELMCQFAHLFAFFSPDVHQVIVSRDNIFPTHAGLCLCIFVSLSVLCLPVFGPCTQWLSAETKFPGRLPPSRHCPWPWCRPHPPSHIIRALQRPGLSPQTCIGLTVTMFEAGLTRSEKDGSMLGIETAPLGPN